MRITSSYTAHPTIDVPPQHPRTAWVRLLAVAVVAQPLLIAVNAIFHPEVDFTGEGLLSGVLESPSTWYSVHMIAAVGAVLGAPAALGLRRLIRGGGRRLGNAAVAASFVAAVVLSMSFATEASTLRAVTEADIGTADAVAVADAYIGTPEFYAVGIGAAVATLAWLLFGAALLWDGSVPRWMPAAMLVGSLASLAAAPGTPVGPIAFAVLAVAGAGLAPRVAATAGSSLS